MRTIVTSIILYVCLIANAQSVSQIKADNSYIYGEGWDSTLKQADTNIDVNLSDIRRLKKKYKKAPIELVKIGRSLYEKKMVTEARDFANAALAASKKKYAPAYILLGDIAVLADDGAAAAARYEQAICVDPKNPDAYYKYADIYRKISPSGAMAKLNDLRVQRPDIAVDALVGRIYYRSNEFDKALAAYDKADMSKMEERDLGDYAMTAFFEQKYVKALEVVKFGLSKNPRHAAFNRLAFFNLTELKQYDEALQFADALFHKSDSAKISYYDYTYYGNAYAGAKQYEKAIEMYEMALSQEDMDNKAKRAGVVKLLSDVYKDKEDYPNAIKFYKEYITYIDKPIANDIAGLAGLYVVQANSIKELNDKKTILIEADAVYGDLASKYENAVEYATFMRARVNAQMDPDSKLGMAKPYYEKLIELIEPRAEKDATERARIIEAYRYMIAYNFIVKEDKDAAKAFATKLQAIDPENEVAKQILESK